MRQCIFDFMDQIVHGITKDHQEMTGISSWQTKNVRSSDQHGHFYSHTASTAKNSFISKSCKVYLHTEVLCLTFTAEIKLILYALKYCMRVYFGK